MNTQKTLFAIYEDDDVVKTTAKGLVAKGIKVRDVYSPFPIHGIDPIIGVRPTRLGDCAFIYGLIAMCLALIGIRYFMIVDWPMNIGGKPSFSLLENLPSFIPVTFEFTVLCAAHGMCVTYFFRNQTLPGMPASNPDPRTTDDRFAIELDTTDNAKFTAEELAAALKETELVEFIEKEYVVEEKI